jgi:hypothetical protein
MVTVPAARIRWSIAVEGRLGALAPLRAALPERHLHRYTTLLP